jgi:hypothetical protein
MFNNPVQQLFVVELILSSFYFVSSRRIVRGNRILQQNPRLEVFRALLEEAVACLRKNTQGMKAKLIFHFDEMRIVKWEA